MFLLCLGWDFSCSNRDENFSDSAKRLSSLDGVGHSLELSEIGAYKDKQQKPGFISCFKCGLLLKSNEIENIAAEKNITFLKAGWFFHANQHPWCEFLQAVKCK